MHSIIIANTDLPTGIEFVRRETTGFGSSAGEQIMLLSNRKFPVEATGEDIKPAPDVWPAFLEYLPLNQIVTGITAYELRTAPIIYAFFYPNDPLDDTITSSHIALSVNDWEPLKIPKTVVYQESYIAVNSVSTQAEHLRAISGLKTERLAEIFNVSRPTYQNWLTSVRAPHESNREHLLEVLPLMEEASQRLGSPTAVSEWLLTPVSSDGKKPTDYLKVKQYSAFRGFLLQVHTGREIFRPFMQPGRARFERSKEDIEYGLERLRPGAWKEDSEEESEFDIES